MILSIGGSFTFKRQTDGQTYSDEVALIAFDGIVCLCVYEFGKEVFSVDR